jgi:hypothetical protein
MLSRLALSQVALSLLLHLPSIVKAQAFVPFKDSRCKEQLKVLSKGIEVPDGKLEISDNLYHGTAIDDIGGRWYDDVTFPDSSTTGGEGVGSNIVYWHVPEPGPHPAGMCVYILMKGNYNGHNIATTLPGDVILVSSTEACIFTALAVSHAPDEKATDGCRRAYAKEVIHRKAKTLSPPCAAVLMSASPSTWV